MMVFFSKSTKEDQRDSIKNMLGVTEIRHYENSLLYRVFKPRFFPNGTILEVPQSQTGSYAWRSLLKGRDVLMESLR